jgi:mannose-6-phosphate isomerase-like protein (cupin superfamily)/GNAT superfamily N-acetyltransferase
VIDCVAGGASVGFMQPCTREKAVAFWRRVADGVAAGHRALLVAEDAQGICGTVQLIFDLPENQPHRADLAKMLVHRRARRQGLGEALMRAAEAAALQCGKTLLVLDAVTGGDAARLYERLGWVRVGDVPNFALMPDGASCSTTYYFRNLKNPVADAGLDGPRSERTRPGALPTGINLAEKLDSFLDHWHPRTFGQFNGHDLMVVKVQGEFVWHRHEESDDFFLVLKGRLTLQLKAGNVVLGPGELFVVPKGVEHCPIAEDETHLLLIERTGTPNTGNAATAAPRALI